MADPVPDNQHSMPRWVKVSGIVAIVVIVVVVAAMALSGGDHGPGRHLPGGDDTPAGHTPPPGGHD